MAVGRSEATLASLAGLAPVHCVVESVATEEGCERIVEETRRRLGAIDILVNNAGIDSGEERPIWQQKTSLWADVMATNLNGPFFLTRAALPDMIEQRWGRVVMVASTAGLVGGARLSGYCSSKHGLVGLIRAAAQDVAPFNVTCNAVCPGWVRTEMSERTAVLEAAARSLTVADIWEERAATIPAGRVLSAGEVAEVIAFLVSDASSGINGEAVTVSLGSPW